MTTLDPNEVIPDGVARRIASEWHGGQSSDLYSFSSTGAIDLGGLLHELDTVQANSAPDPQGALADLRALRVYVATHGSRGPVPTWARLWSDAVVPWSYAKDVVISSCEQCRSTGQVVHAGESLNTRSGVRGRDPQHDVAEDCPSCGGLGGHVAVVAR